MGRRQVIARAALVLGLAVQGASLGCSRAAHGPDPVQAAPAPVIAEPPPPAPAPAPMEDFESSFECGRERPGSVRGRLKGRLWVDSLPPRDAWLDFATVDLHFRDSTDAPGSAPHVLTRVADALGQFEISPVPLTATSADLWVIDPRVDGARYKYVHSDVTSLFSRCVVPERDRLIPVVRLARQR